MCKRCVSRPDYLPGYLYRIVRNLSLAKYHSNTAAKRNSLYDVALEELEDCIPGGSSVEEEVAGKELAFLLNRFLGTLNRENRILFVRRYWYADSIGELAERFGASSNAISVRLSRVRGKLKKFLEIHLIFAKRGRLYGCKQKEASVCKSTPFQNHTTKGDRHACAATEVRGVPDHRG